MYRVRLQLETLVLVFSQSPIDAFSTSRVIYLCSTLLRRCTVHVKLPSSKILPSAVDSNTLTRNEPSFVANEKRDKLGNFIRLSYSTMTGR